MENLEKPFSKSYVLRTTAKHMRKSIDISIRKTFERVKDFDSNGPKSREVFETLSILHQMRSHLDKFQEDNKEEFKD
jgi:gas vesicle protein